MFSKTSLFDLKVGLFCDHLSQYRTQILFFQWERDTFYNETLVGFLSLWKSPGFKNGEKTCRIRAAFETGGRAWHIGKRKKARKKHKNFWGELIKSNIFAIICSKYLCKVARIEQLMRENIYKRREKKSICRKSDLVELKRTGHFNARYKRTFFCVLSW